MNYKTAIIIFLALVGFIVFVLVGFMFVYSIDPSLLGFEPKLTKADSLKIQQEKKLLPKVEKYLLTQTQYEKFLKQIEELQKAIIEKDGQIADLKAKKDTLYKEIYTKEELVKQRENLVDSVQALKKALMERFQEISQYKDSILKLNKTIEFTQKEIKTKDEKIAQIQKAFNRQIDSMKLENFRQFSEMFKTAQPREIARILEQIDERDAAQILKMLPKKQAGKIIEALPPDRAAVIMLLGSGQ